METKAEKGFRPHENVSPKVEKQLVAQPGVLKFFLIFRLVNALCVQTFFQPDEYFQALEPAWRFAFGKDSGAWMTWEWQHQLRSSLHPVFFGLAYRLVNDLTYLLHVPADIRSFILVLLPKVLQSALAGLGDFYTWRLASAVFGGQSNVPWATIGMNVFSPWQWYCSTRTFSNSLETTLTVVALYYWPWEVLGDEKDARVKVLQQSLTIKRFRLSLIFAAIAVLLRPTNLLIWLGILFVSLTSWTLSDASPLKWKFIGVVFREIIVCGSAVLAVSALSDRLFFGFWAFPPYNFLHYNLMQNLSVFYGHMKWHYYLSQGLPLLTTTFLPFALIGVSRPIGFYKSGAPVLQANILKTLSSVVRLMIAALSMIAHKESRFIYPLLPMLHILAAPSLTAYFTSPPNLAAKSGPDRPISLRHKFQLATLLSTNILVAVFLTQLHQPAPINVTNFLRSEFQRLHPNQLVLPPSDAAWPRLNSTCPGDDNEQEMFALFLTPCHTTPWRSHFVWPGLRARALTCEPPLATDPGSLERAQYLGEDDRFYLNEGDGQWGVGFLGREIWPVVSASADPAVDDDDDDFLASNPPTSKQTSRGGDLPRFIVGFDGIEGMLKLFFSARSTWTVSGVAKTPRLRRVWVGWNGVFNEDSRRRDRLVVWETGVYPDSARQPLRSGSAGGSEGVVGVEKNHDEL